MKKHWLSVGCALATLAFAQGARAQDQAGAQSGDQSDRDIIIVTGYRESIAAARDTKRDATAIVDAIVAEDIAQFPQSNLSEAVQRISGVQIRRDYAGAVGNEISIRGLGPEYTQVTVNGQSAPTDSEDRTFNFNILPADLFRKVEVYKSPTADLEEGGIGGTVELETIRPLDLKKKLFAVSVGGNYNEMTDRLLPSGSVVAGGKLSPTLGVVGALVYDKSASASQSYDAVRWTRTNLDVNGDKVNDYSNAFVLYPRLIHEEQDVRRISATGRIEWEPSDRLNILVDGLYTNFRQDYRRYSPIWNFPGGKTVTGIHVDTSDPDNQIVDQIGFGSVNLRSENHGKLNKSEMFQGGISAEYRFGGWKVKGFVNKSRNNRNSEEFVYYGDNTSAAAYDTRENSDYFAIVTPVDIADPGAYVTTEARHYLIDTRDDAFAAGFELKGDLHPGLALKAGAKYNNRERTRERFYTRRTKINEPFSLIGDVLTGFLDDEDGAAAGPHAFAIADFDKGYDLYGSALDVSNSAEFNNFFDVREKSVAGYVMATYRQSPIVVNLGVRLVHTSVTSDGVELDKVTGDQTAIAVKSDYTDVLPSLNLRYEAAPSLFVRASVARVMTRPGLGDLAAYRTVDDATRTISAKNPGLQPFRANQADLSVEWYFGKSSLLSVGYFYKNIESFIVTESSIVDYNGEDYTLTQPVNGNDARVQGFEFNYQQPFTFLPGPLRHLGVVANYTYTDSSFQDTIDDTTITYGLPENSKHSFNLIGYYEDRDFSLRLAYNYRSEFLRDKPNEQDGLKYRSPYGQADLAARYALAPGITLTLDVLNLFNAHTDEYIYQRRLTDGRFTAGRTARFGLRASF